MRAVDLFAGAGGWCVGARRLGIEPLGIELDPAACSTREAASLPTLQGDVAALDPTDYPCELLIASPPCQAYSVAGKRAGERDKRHVHACALGLGAGMDDREEHAAACEDPRSLLVVEPLRWALALRPRLIALEQVPPVLELWQAFARLLAGAGYRTWTGILHSECWGVPQTRKRAFLLASLDGPALPPRPTHQLYVKGEGPRHEMQLDGEILPWVSMAEALGWGLTARPSVTLTAGSGRGGGADPLDGGTGSREAIADAREAGAWTVRTGTNSMKVSRDPQDMEPYERPVDEPAPTVDGKVGRAWKVAPPGEHVDPPQRWKMQAGSQGNATVRDVDEPAPTIKGGHSTAERLWVFDQPATTVAGDPPGHKENSDDPPGKFEQRRGENAIRVSVAEAAALQSFPPDHPWRGSKTAQYQQVGNACPVLLSLAVLGALLGRDWRPIAERYIEEAMPCATGR